MPSFNNLLPFVEFKVQIETSSGANLCFSLFAPFRNVVLIIPGMNTGDQVYLFYQGPKPLVRLEVMKQECRL